MNGHRSDINFAKKSLSDIKHSKVYSLETCLLNHLKKLKARTELKSYERFLHQITESKD